MKEMILYAGAFELPDKNALAHRVLSNAKIFRELGYDVVFLGIDKSGDTQYQTVQGFPCYARKYPEGLTEWFRYLTEIQSIKALLEKHKQIKTVILYNYQAAAFWRVMRLCHKRGIRVIADCADWYDAKGSSPLFYCIKMLDSFLRMRIIQPKTDGMIVISSYLQKYYHRHRHVLCLPTLVDKQEEKWEIDQTDGKKQMLRLAYAGSPGQAKDRLDILTDVVNRHEDTVELTVAGISEEEYTARYGGTVCGNIRFLGRIPHKDSLRVVHHADFSVFIRERDKMTMAGFPTKFAESISAGTPVITTDTSDISDYLCDGVNGFLITGDIRNRLNEILDMDISALKRMKQNVDSNLFDYRRYIEQTKLWLEEIQKADD